MQLTHTRWVCGCQGLHQKEHKFGGEHFSKMMVFRLKNQDEKRHVQGTSDMFPCSLIFASVNK